MTPRTVRLLAMLLPALVGSGAAQAGCVACVCTATAVTLDFGIYVPTAVAPADGVGAVRVRCSLGGTGTLPLLTSYDIGLSAGASGSTAMRQMRSSGNRLDYNLYTDAARSTVWGDAGTSDQVTVPYGTSLFGTWVQTDVYGRITARQNIQPGSYGDTITVTVTY